MTTYPLLLPQTLATPDAVPALADAVVLADGDFPRAAVPLSLLHGAPVVVCCDGASRHWPQADAIVGDGDSVPSALRQRLIMVSEQDDNDLTKATHYCLSHGLRRIVYLGATGRREDHTLGNISLMVRYKALMGAEPLMATDHGWFVVGAAGRSVFASFARQQVSLFSFGCQHLSTSGLKWPGRAYAEWWQGTLNEATGDTFSVEADSHYLIFRTYNPK